MALLFSFSLAMDKFVIGSVVTAIDYPSIQSSIRLAVATALTTGRSPWRPFLGSTPKHEDAPLHASAQLDVRIGSSKIMPACLT
jgi:hypothetical protein